MADENTSVSTYGPRAVRLTRTAWIIRIVFSVATLLIVGIAGTFAYRDVSQLSKLAQYGLPVTGKVTDLAIKNGKGRSYFLDYEFEQNGTLQTGRDRISEAEYKAKSLGDPITLTSLPDHPEIHRLGPVTEDRVRKSLGLWLLGITAGALMSLVILAVTEWQIRSETRILRDYEAVSGRISEIAQSSGGKTPTQKVTYRYRPLRGDERDGTTPMPTSTASKLSIGDTITVLTDPEEIKPPRLLSTIAMVKIDDSLL